MKTCGKIHETLISRKSNNGTLYLVLLYQKSGQAIMLCFTNCLDFFSCFFFFQLWCCDICSQPVETSWGRFWFYCISQPKLSQTWSVYCAFHCQFKLRVSFNPLALRGDYHGTSPYNTHTLSCKQVLRKFQLIRKKLLKLSGSLKHHLVYSVLRPRHWNKCCKTVHHSPA